MKKKVLVITGPTGTGKTKLGIELAKRLDGEIVSADSMQIYKEMDIGTAKPDNEELSAAVHHMIDIVEVGESFSVADYVEKARKCIDDIISRGKVPIVVGGTGLYINSIVEEINYFDTNPSEEYRNKLLEIAKAKGNEVLYNDLKQKDPKACERIHINDLKRIIRALEVYEFSNNSITKQQEMSKMPDKKYDYVVIGLTTDRETIYDRINRRVDKMFEEGLLEEASKIIKKADALHTSYQAIGYKELKKYFDGEIPLEEAKDKIKQETRHYAKRQLTWFRRNQDIVWLDIKDDFNDNVNKVLRIFLEL